MENKGWIRGEPLTFIQGVGSNVGIFWKHASSTPGDITYPELFATYLLCSYKYGVKTYYHNELYDGNCNPKLQVRDFETGLGQESKIYLYPQPTRSMVRINNNTGRTISTIHVFTTQGKLVQRVSGDNLMQLDIGELLPGLYYIKLFSDKDYLARKPIIIN